MVLNLRHNDRPYILAGIVVFAVVAATLWWAAGALAAVLVVQIAAVAAIVVLLVHLYRSRQDEDRAQFRKTQAAIALHQLLHLRAPLPPMTGWASSPEFAAALYEAIREDRPQQVVELGSGVSTIVMAYALEQHGGGRLLSLDHEAEYRAATEKELSIHGLERLAQVRLAPLATVSLNGRQQTWYDLAGVELDRPIDMLVVDGPPHETDALARYPAVPFFLDCLAPDAVVVLDDAHRDDEKATVERWSEMLCAAVDYVESEKGIAILRRNARSD